MQLVRMLKRWYLALSISVLVFSFDSIAQKPKKSPKRPIVEKVFVDEKAELEKAIALSDAVERIKALQDFIKKFPKSPDLNRAKNLIVSGRAELGEQKLQAGETEIGIQYFKDAVADLPTPIADNFFSKVVLNFPTNLFYRGQQIAALQVALGIERKVKDNPKQLLGLAAFYLGIERMNEARMLAEAAINLAPEMPEAYQTLALAKRMNFELAEAEQACTKAVELAPASVISKRSLAEIKRAVGKPGEAAQLYREMFEKDPNDVQANNGLILALFDLGNQTEAEELLAKALESNPNNLFLLVGAAYWYAGQKNGAKAVELAQKAVEIEPRYTWARIALARGLMLQNQPLEAEKALLVAQKYGSFPTLDYEIATARFQAGLYEEAARELKKQFVINDGYVQTYLAGRVPLEAQNFVELLDLERKASIFTPASADTVENSERLKTLLDFSQKLADKRATEEELSQAADAFVKGDDKMKPHRQIFAAARLLEAKKSLSKVLQFTQGAVKGLDGSLQVPNPEVAVLADDLIESRALALAKDQVIVVPKIPLQTLSRIMRGRIEEITGWTLYQQNKSSEAVVRLKRAVSILPEKSAWWRSSYWRLGLAYDAAGDFKNALDALVKSYTAGGQDRFRRITIEAVYRKVKGNLDGLDTLIGVDPFARSVARTKETTTPSLTSQKTEVKPNTTPDPGSNLSSEEKIESTHSPNPGTSDMGTPRATKPEDSPKPKPPFDPIVIEIGKPIRTAPPTENSSNSGEANGRTFTRQGVRQKTSVAPSCLEASENSVSVSSNGGTFEVLVGSTESRAPSKISFESSSQDDVVVIENSGNGQRSSRSSFIIKSVSDKKGLFTVTFTSACGKKEIHVRVR